MKHWNFFPCIFLLLAIFWWRHIDFRIEELRRENSRPKTETIFDGPFKLDLPPVILPQIKEQNFDPLGPNNANEWSKKSPTQATI